MPASTRARPPHRPAFTLPQPHASTLPQPRAFTLIELLVVIGIIAVLMSILLPSLSRARQQANLVKCQSQLREIGNAFHAYLAENKGVGNFSFFQVTAEPKPGGGTYLGTTMYWFAKLNLVSFTEQQWDFNEGYLSRYFKNPKLVECPTLLDYTQSSLMGADFPRISYVYNVQAGSGSPAADKRTRRFASFKKPAETLALMDGISVTSSMTLDLTYVSNAYGANSGNGVRNPAFHGRHRDQGNVLWYDGHVTAETPFIAKEDVDLESSWRPRKALLSKNNVGYLTPYTHKSLPEGVTTLDALHTQYLANPSSTKHPGHYYWINKIIKQ